VLISYAKMINIAQVGVAHVTGEMFVTAAAGHTWPTDLHRPMSVIFTALQFVAVLLLAASRAYDIDDSCVWVS